MTENYLVYRQADTPATLVPVAGQMLGQGFHFIAGPCSVEAAPVSQRIAEQLAAQGVRLFRAGAYKPRTDPYRFQGLADAGLVILADLKQQFGFGVVTEVLAVEDIPAISAVADMLQVGTRNMTNTALLKALGAQSKPVLLKRGMAATVDEFLLAAEYILAGGNPNVILCERGLRCFTDHCRYLLDIAAIPVLKQRTHLPVIVDPSHAAGRRELVAPLARAAAAAGADGLLVEVHDQPEHALSDGLQAITPATLARLQLEVTGIREVLMSDNQAAMTL